MLVLGAHPDDEIGCAGTVHRLTQQGSEVNIVTFSECIDAIPDGFEASDLTTEWARAAGRLGIGVKLIDNVPNRLFTTYRQAVLGELDVHVEVGYDLILCPASFDLHQDHATVSQEAARAFKRTTILGYELPLNEVFETRLSAFVELSGENLTAKVEAAAIYATQADRPYMQPQFLRGLAVVRGVQSGRPLAEAFEVIRWVL